MIGENVFLIGGSGFLGSYVANALLEKGCHVTIGDLHKNPDLENIPFVKLDLLDKASLEEGIPKNVNYVLNFGGLANIDDACADPVRCIELNVFGNTNALEVCKTRPNIKRFIFASSAYALSDKGSFYGISKFASEKIVEEYFRKYSLKYTIIRFGSIYADKEFKNNYIYQLVKKALLTGKIYHDSDGEEEREYIHAIDCANLCAQIIGDPRYENEHIILTGMEKFKRKELFLQIKEMLSQNLDIELGMKDDSGNHYKKTPYSFYPNLSKKLVANPFIDMGQGILECMKDVRTRYKDIYEKN